MDILHLTYDDVVNRIPYRNLLIMQKDRLHEITGDIITYHSARDNIKFKNRKKK